MRFEPTKIPEVILIEPDVHRDVRGFFLETFHEKKYRDGGIDARFIQDNQACSVGGTLRGLHAQRGFPQAKLVRCTDGEIWDVAVDIRRGSRTFGRWVAVSLSAENFRQIYVPPGFAHGYCALSERAQVEYKVTAFYHPEAEIGILWNDPDLAIDWPVKDPLLSEKDRANRPLGEMLELLPSLEGA